MPERTRAEREMEEERRRRIREDAKRPLSVNLAETISHSRALMRLARDSGSRR